MGSSQQRVCAWRSARERLATDERGLGVIEYVVMLVLVVALGVALWNLFGNDVTCRFADAADAFDDPSHVAGQQCTGHASSGSSRPSHTGASRPSRPAASHPSAAAGSTTLPTASVLGSASPGVAPSVAMASAALSAPSASNGSAGGSPGTGEASPSLTSRIGDALAAVGETAVDFAEGAIAGVSPFTPLVTPTPTPSFGHEISFGVGQTVGSVGGLLWDAGKMAAGSAGVGVSLATIVATDGAAIPVAGPAALESGAVAVAGAASASGHISNLQDGIHNVLHGNEPGPKPSEPSAGGGHDEKPPAEQGPAAGEKPSAPHEGGPAPAGKPASHTPVKPADLGVTVRANGNEVFYRTMSQADAAELAKTGKMPATSETTISPTQSFSESYRGVLVEFEVKPGTTAKLQEIGVRDAAKQSQEVLPDMPVGKAGWGAEHARFKSEGGQFNIGLGTGKGLATFNSNIDGFRIVSP